MLLITVAQNLILTQGNLRKMVNMEERKMNMMNSARIIELQAYEYITTKPRNPIFS
jgi:hypothetical protein